MKLLKTFREKDVFPLKNESEDDVIFEDRNTGKAVILDNDNKVALIGNSVNSFYVLPGGGIEEGENIEAGVIRECLEEIGCNVTLENPVGITEDYRNRDKKHCINYCYVAKVVGEKGEPQLTEEEMKNGVCVSWFTIDEAIKILEDEVKQLERGEIEFYNTGFNIMRDHLFLIEAKEILEI